ncbi:Cyanophycin synthetase [Planktothrix tepida]|uniref:Cyanophycin synthetase n=2 Tax=Planktothrix TaxID=54304 RepID=A0A1J1LRZ7_9CYAN|nr:MULTISPECIES: cyanophycin synthetase [Planktothrix]CAD5942744.1 Cyanophycin synthetase [Planktothrix pseudagardhii]CAD5968160.1 Cyanophycin synthetase [Planktothrix tepida]CUR35175.1 Cyanophycin synthetase [Planktothrix tepida PCC 9214]
MKILKTQTLCGPNYWSIDHHHLIIIHLDLEKDNRYTHEIPDFYEGLLEIFPHFNQSKYQDFMTNVKTGILMSDIVLQVALELQTLAGMPVEFGCTRPSAQTEVYRVIFQYKIAEAGRYAARAAVRLCHRLIDDGYYRKTELQHDLQDLQEIFLDAQLGPTTEAIVREAESRGIPWRELPARHVIQLGYGKHQRRIQASQTDGSNILAIEFACDKEGTKTLLDAARLPVPKGTVINSLDDLENAIDEIGGFPIVLKPLDGNHGRGITLDIQTWHEAENAYQMAKNESKIGSVIVERYYKGNDYRVLVVQGKVVAVAQRVPAHVIGNGRSTLVELVEDTNRDPRRGMGHENMLTRIEIDRQSIDILDQQGYRLESIPKSGQICYLKATANLSTGGIAIDRTDEIHPENIWIAERAAQIIGLDIAGIDITAPDISRPLREVDGVIVEVNAAPGLRMHIQPNEGKPRNVAAPIVDMLFPPGTSAQIPITAITGTNGKTTTTRLTAHIFKQTQKVVGYTTTDGTYIGDFLAEAGDNTGPASAALILNDPTVEIAVLEAARGGILRSGLGFNRCDVGVVLNVSEDHLGLQDINTVEEMADVKSVVAKVAHKYAVLNADDPLVAAMASQVKAKVAYFSLQADNPIVNEHVAQGGVAAIYESGYLSFLKGEQMIRVEQMANVPLTLRGLAPFMIANALAASLAAYLQGVTIAEISQGLRTFEMSVEQTPGRMNLIPYQSFHILLDYAHNRASFQAILEFVRNWPDGKRIGVVGAPGDRRQEDFIELGRLAAQMFERIIIKEDEDNRGCPRGDVAKYIQIGVKKENPDFDCEIILQETAALETAFKEASPGSLVVIFPESVKRVLALLQ